MIYTYECTTCNSRIEKQSLVIDRDNQYCDVCGEHLTRLVDLPNFVLGGTCWTRDNWTKKQSSDSIRKELKNSK